MFRKFRPASPASRHALFCALGLLALGLLNAPSRAADGTPVPPSPPARTDCGLDGTEEERLADCELVFGERSRHCDIELGFQVKVVPCSHLETYYADGFTVRESRVMTGRNGYPIVMKSNSRTRPVESDDAYWSLHPVLSKSACGKSGMTDERARDCAERAAAGSVSRACYVNAGSFHRLIACSHSTVYFEDGLRVRGWEMIYSDGGKIQVWRDLESRVVTSAIDTEVTGIWSATRLCQKPSRGDSIKGGLQNSLAFDVPNCRDLVRDMREGLRYLIRPERSLQRKIACWAEYGFAHIDTSSLTVADSSPFEDFSAICQAPDPLHDPNPRGQ